MNRWIATMCTTVALSAIAPAGASAQLGTVDFPTSCSAAIQPTLNRALALLHSFQYEEADDAFRDAGRRDRQCAIAHWGRAMTLYHPLWGEWPTPAQFRQARIEVAHAKAIRTQTRRERMYVAAAAAFFQNRALSRAARVKRYVDAAAALSREFPDDHEATAFHALSLVALGTEHVEDLANLRQAIAILQPVLRDYPDHPGAAHYLIHAADRPELASLGLEAAKKYAAIAPDSPHALHMPAHIFVRLGLWQETIDVNLRSATSGARGAMGHHGSPSYQLHAIDFLEYAYLQTGQERMARQALAEIRDVPGASEYIRASETAYGAARIAIELHRWAEAAALPVVNTDFSDTYRARAIGAARTGDVVAARADLAKLREATRQAGTPAMDLSVDVLEVVAWVALADGRIDEALDDFRKAAAKEEQDGGESVAVPAREMLGDALLELKRPAEALTAYQAALAFAPNRFNALYGAARAADLVGDRVRARDYWGRLRGITAVTADRPESAEVRTALTAP